MSTLVLHYGLLGPTQDTAHLVDAELRRAHRFRNRLIEIEIARRDALRALELADSAVFQARAVVAAELASYLAASSVRNEMRSRVRSRGDVPNTLDKAAKQAKAKLDKARAALRVELRRLRGTKAYKTAVCAIEAAASADAKRASAESGVAWGTKQRHQQAMDASRSMKPRGDGKPAPGALWDDLEPHNPRFRLFDQCGMLGVQLIGGVSMAARRQEDREIGGCSAAELAGSAFIQIERTPTEQPGKGKRFARLRMRIGSMPDRSPVWGEWPLFLDRPLPPGCRIMRAGVDRIMRGERAVWELNITVEKDSALSWNGKTGWGVSASTGHGSVGIDIGWRVIGDELRVCAWVGEDGRHGELRLSACDIEALTRAERIRGHRDDHFNAIRVSLARWLRSHDHSAWLDRETAQMSAWKSPRRLLSLCYGWDRFDGDAEIVALLMWWREKERHLRTYEAEQRQQGLDRRLDLYRCFAKRLASRYDVAVVEDFDLRKVARKRDAKDIDADNETARHNRQVAAVSELRAAIRNAFLRCGGYQKVPAPGTTQTCAETTLPELFNAAPQIDHACQCGCGLTWDQDLNAARNIIRLGSERVGDSKDPGAARKYEIERQSSQKREGRFQRLKRLKASRRQEDQEKDTLQNGSQWHLGARKIES